MKTLMVAAAAVMATVLVGVGGYYVYRQMAEAEVAGEEAVGLDEIRPRNMRIIDVRSDGFTVTWKVASSVSGYVQYGETSTSISRIAQDVAGAVGSIEHTVNVYNLEPGRKYYFWVMSDEVAFGKNGRALEVLTLSE